MSDPQADLPEYPWDAFKAPAPTAHPPSGVELPDNPWDTFGPPTVNPEVANLKPQDLASKIYHPLIEGSAVMAGSAAGGAIGTLAAPVLGPVGPAGGAVIGAGAFYPAGKYVADAIDKIRGVVTEQQSLGEQMKEGANIELGGQVLGAVAKPAIDAGGAVLSAVLPGAKAGEAISGTPGRNLSRAFKNGFVDTFLSPISKEEAGENFGEEYSKLMGDHFTPEQQADLLLNPNGIAKESLNVAIQKQLTGKPLTIQEAIAARQGIDQLMPSQTAKNLPRVQGFSSFREYLNHVIGEQAPEFKKASDDYAAAALRDQLLKFGQVNKSNPNEYSKLGMLMFETMAGVAGIGGKSLGDAAKVLALQQASSPFAMGLVASASGTASRATMRALSNPLIQRAAVSALNDYFAPKSDSPDLPASTQNQNQDVAKSNPASIDSGNQPGNLRLREPQGI